ncbi:MAG: hemagglutinin repeat-containing protein, partial [Negativicoccus succinicivorans]|nr:hemagglutinin repeat-containing protein [Negativicoccus succinicivorans]
AIALQGSDLNNRGRIEADDVTLKLEDAFTHTGDLIVAKKLAAEAGTIRMTAPDILAQEPSHHDYARRGVVVTEKDGLLYLHADRNVYIQNRQISHSGSNGTLVIDAGGDILLDAQTYEYTVGTTQTADNVRHITTESGSIVEAEGDITLQAEGDIKIKAGAVRSAQGSLRLLADRDIEITTGHTRMDSSYYWRHRNGGISSKRGHFSQQETGQIKDPISTELLGNNILLAAKRDISLLSSNSIDRGNTRFKAGRDITSAVDTALQKTEYTKTFEGSGISFGKGLFGIRIGKWSEVHNSSETEETPVPTRITSVGGTVDLDAEGKVHATATYIYGKDGVSISGASVALDGAYAKRTYSQTDAYSFKGLQIGLGGTTVSYLNNAYVFGQNALRARDNRLKILEGVETKSEFDKAWNDYFDNTTSNNKITLSVALVSDKTKQTYDNVVVRSVGGSVASEGDIVIRAKDIQNGEIKLIGQTLSGKDIRLETYHLDIASGDNHSTTETGSHDSHAEIGADFGKSGYIAPKIGYAASQNETEET